MFFFFFCRFGFVAKIHISTGVSATVSWVSVVDLPACGAWMAESGDTQVIRCVATIMGEKIWNPHKQPEFCFVLFICSFFPFFPSNF